MAHLILWSAYVRSYRPDFADTIERLGHFHHAGTDQMKSRSANPGRATIGFLGLMAASLAVLLLLPPIHQDQSYHSFADERKLFGVPNFWNVVSNLPFIGVGAVGLRQFHKAPAVFVIFLGMFLTGFGSSYYHWDPSDGTLFWDRLPMTLCFMAILADIVAERVDKTLGSALLWPLVATGILSLLLWRFTGDLRLYAWVQFFPLLALPLLILIFPPKCTCTIYWVVAAALYALAKAFELLDQTVYAKFILSGHTLKHLLAVAACFVVLRYFQTRRPIVGVAP
jgi:Ceramidase